MDITQAWRVLNLAPDTTPAELRRRFRAFTRDLHPDTRRETNPDLDERYRTISIAFEVARNDLDERMAVAWALEQRPLQVEGVSRGATALDAWLTMVAFWRCYPDKPRQIDATDVVAMRSWLRLHEHVKVGLQLRPRAHQPAGAEPMRSGLPGVEMRASIRLPVMVSILGGYLEVELELQGSLRRFALDVPVGIDVGGEFRIQGAGGPGVPRGDLVLVVEALDLSGSRFRRKGLTLTTRRKVTYAQVYAGRIVSVCTPWGTAQLQLRPGDETPHRLVGQGVKHEGAVGDLVVELEVVRPAPGNAKLAAALLEAQHWEPEHRSPGDPPSDRSAR